jgi:hypothetical protein
LIAMCDHISTSCKSHADTITIYTRVYQQDTRLYDSKSYAYTLANHSLTIRQITHLRTSKSYAYARTINSTNHQHKTFLII